MTTQWPDTMAPNYSLLVNNNRVDANVRACIQQIEYESNDGLADMLKIRIQDRFDEVNHFPIINSKLFLPGNDLALWGGYGSALIHIGSAIITKVIPTFPRSGPPTLEVVAYTPDQQMADTGPEALKDVKGLKSGGRRVKNAKAGRRWPAGTRYSDAVIDRAQAYGFLIDVDQAPISSEGFIQKANMKDYHFVTGIAHLTGFVMWVDSDGTGKYTLHFKDPTTLKQKTLQDVQYEFKYADGDYSTLLEFTPEFAISQQVNKVQIESMDPETGKTFFAKIEEDTNDDPDVLVDPGNTTTGFDAKAAGLSRVANASKSDVKPGKNSTIAAADVPFVGDIHTASSVKIFIDNWAFDVRANRRFRNEQELALWAAQWFRRNRENFMLCKGALVGIETLRARQVHTLSGMGKIYDGDYYFSRVRHLFNTAVGYEVDFDGRKQVPELPPVTSTDDLDIEQQFIKDGALNTGVVTP